MEPGVKEKNRLWAHSSTEYVCPSNIHNPLCVALGVGPLGGNWVCVRSWRWSPMLRSLVSRWRDQSSLSLCPIVYNEWEDSHLKIRKRILPRRGICQCSLGLPVFRSVRNKCVLSKFPSLWYSVVAALTEVQSKGAEGALINECFILLA